jgi:hypothetical protein
MSVGLTEGTSTIRDALAALGEIRATVKSVIAETAVLNLKLAMGARPAPNR